MFALVKTRGDQNLPCRFRTNLRLAVQLSHLTRGFAKSFKNVEFSVNPLFLFAVASWLHHSLRLIFPAQVSAFSHRVGWSAPRAVPTVSRCSRISPSGSPGGSTSRCSSSPGKTDRRKETVDKTRDKQCINRK